MLGVTTVVGFCFFARIKLGNKLIALMVEDSDSPFTSMRHDREMCKIFHFIKIGGNRDYCPKCIRII